MENYLYYSDPFFAYNNSLYIEKTINGKPVNIKLSNFLARITEDITCTNGAENERFLSIVGTDDKGKDLRKITVPLKNFAQLDWAQEYWGINCVIESGYGNRDNLRQAIQSTAKYAEAKTIYGTTGWWETATGWQFCMPGNSNAEVELTEKTKGYSFKTDSDIIETMTVMKNFPYSVAPKEIMLPMLSYTLVSVLGTFMARAGKETKTVIMLYGKTGSMKTTLSLLINSLFGRFNEDNIPMNFRDTPKSILNYCFTLKDCAVVIDDYHPGSGREQSAQDATTQALIRGICNREARGALDKSGRQRAAKRPQCNVIMTAEYLPNVGESGVARFLSLELKPGDINLNELTKYQKEAEEGTLSHFTFLATDNELGIDVLKFTSDGTWCNMLSGGTIDGVLPTLNFGSRASSAFNALKPYGDIPKMCMEFWCGWFDHFGEKHHTRKADNLVTELEEFLKQGASFNMYMFLGGTNFGFTAGANHIKRYEPTVTSYDYCAPLTEWGDYTDTYHKIRKLLCEHQNIPMAELLAPPIMQNIGKVKFTESADLFDNLDNIAQKHYSPLPRSMEAYGQNFGLVYYVTKLKGKYDAGFLSIADVHDYAHVYFEKKKIATINRCKKASLLNKLKLKKQLFIKGTSSESEIGVLVEGMGRVNYGKEFYDRKGISNIYFANQVLTDFDVYTIPLDNLDCLKFGELKAENKNGPVFLKGTFKAGKGECFVDMNGFTKGYVFVNGFNLGRYWDIGPQKALYLPGALLKEENEIIVFEIEKYKTPEIVIGDTPMLG